jgi:hypothetical protein
MTWLRWSLVAALAGCTPHLPPPDPLPPLPEQCALACARLAELGCPAGGTTPQGATCHDVCRNNTEGALVVWTRGYLRCLAALRECTEELACQ